ncbi:MAG: bifunctional riboflavin kinase/FAD synthetase [Gammaproteobacteria bacterium]|nr:bifunctional riboflavin kinase/FAD synthetase [Gammaproteobacteria bacterium]
MKVITETDVFPDRHRGCAATIGKFDGVHLGHQLIVRQLRSRSVALDVPSVVIVIEPHPEEFFAANARDCPPRLSEAPEKVELLSALGVDYVYLMRFDAKLSSLTPQAYIEQMLLAGLNIKSLIIGNDFRFGCKRSGDFSLLQTYGAAHGFEVLQSESCFYAGTRVSSTYVRECLSRADFATVAALLGRDYSIAGTVVKGRQLGRNLGYPTCNLALNRQNIPLHGVYACKALITTVDGTQVEARGAANIGYRPTVIEHQQEAWLEVHLLDFNQDIYGAKMSVVFCHHIRNEQKFESLQALTDQIARDVQQVRMFFDSQTI